MGTGLGNKRQFIVSWVSGELVFFLGVYLPARCRNFGFFLSFFFSTLSLGDFTKAGITIPSFVFSIEEINSLRYVRTSEEMSYLFFFSHSNWDFSIVTVTLVSEGFFGILSICVGML